MTNCTVLMSAVDIEVGKAGFQKADLMDYGSLYGMGSYFGEDYTAADSMVDQARRDQAFGLGAREGVAESLVGTANGSRPPPAMPRCPTSKSPGASNAHSPGDGGSGLVQPVFRSPARIQPRKPPAEDCAPRRQAKNAIRYRSITSARVRSIRLHS
jgi:hypothetical protein